MPEFPLTNAYWPAQTSHAAAREHDRVDSPRRRRPRSRQDRAHRRRPGRRQRRRWTYRALLADAERTARALLRRFSPGERIAVWAGNSPEWLILEFAAALAGLTLVTVNPAYRGDELAHVLGHSEADGLFMADDYQGADLRAILAESAAGCPGCARSSRSATARFTVRESATRRFPRSPRPTSRSSCTRRARPAAQGRAAHPSRADQQRAAPPRRPASVPTTCWSTRCRCFTVGRRACSRSGPCRPPPRTCSCPGSPPPCSSS